MAKSIFKTYDQFGTIDVLDDGTKRYLTFGSADEQSLQVKATPHVPQHEYGRAIMLSLLLCKPSSVCVMGLGGGTLTQAFFNALPDADIHTVELRLLVIKVAKRFFKIDKKAALNIHHQDAHDFLNTTALSFDLIVADLYDHNGIDEGQLQQDFIKNSAGVLTDTGWLVLNYWLDHDLSQALLDQLNSEFECIYVCNSGGGNSIIYAGKVQPPADFLDKDIVKPLAKTLGFSLNYYLKRLRAFTS
jgi:spermidine synthase